MNSEATPTPQSRSGGKGKKRARRESDPPSKRLQLTTMARAPDVMKLLRETLNEERSWLATAVYDGLGLEMAQKYEERGIIFMRFFTAAQGQRCFGPDSCYDIENVQTISAFWHVELGIKAAAIETYQGREEPKGLPGHDRPQESQEGGVPPPRSGQAWGGGYRIPVGGPVERGPGNRRRIDNGGPLRVA